MRVLLDIKDNKAIYLMELLNDLPFVKTKTITEAKAIEMENLKNAVEELNLIKQGKLKGISVNDLLNEL
jgi:hypothetical protein